MSKVEFEQNGVIDDRVSLCIWKLEDGNYIVGSYIPSLAEHFNPIKGQAKATADCERQWKLKYDGGLTSVSSSQSVPC